jgi:hypothetical protein
MDKLPSWFWFRWCLSSTGTERSSAVAHMVLAVLLDKVCSVALWAALLQLVGSGLLVWGLKLSSDMGTWYTDESGKPRPYAGITREHPWAVTFGLWALFVGLALQVVAALL